MTPEQRQVIGRCGRMLRLSFQGMAGKVVYRLDHDKPVRWEYAQYGSECKRQDYGDESATVDLTA